MTISTVPRTRFAALVVLTFSTGVIDAVGYLGLDRVFTGNMTGNVVILGMALTGADGLPIAGPVVALIGFLLGGLIAGRVSRGRSTGWSRASSLLLSATGVVQVVLALFLWAATVETESPSMLGVTGLLGVAMGIQAGAARHIALAEMNTVVVTSTLLGLAFDSPFAARITHPWARRLASVVVICAGAVCGALLLRIDVAAGVAASAVLTFVAVALGDRGRDRR